MDTRIDASLILIEQSFEARRETARTHIQGVENDIVKISSMLTGLKDKERFVLQGDSPATSTMIDLIDLRRSMYHYERYLRECMMVRDELLFHLKY